MKQGPLTPGAPTLIQSAFSPPTGYRASHALVTTYSVESEVAALALCNLAGLGEISLDPQKQGEFDWRKHLLTRVEQLRGKVAIFYERGRISTRQRSIIEALFPSFLFPIRPPHDGSFHPKLSILRFIPVESGEVLYRLLCSTRNLTRSSMWELLFIAEARVGKHRTEQGEGLRFFAQHVRANTKGRHDLDDRGHLFDVLMKELSNLRFSIDRAYESEWSFIPLLPGQKGGSPFTGLRSPDRLLIVSPFLNAHWIKDVVRKTPMVERFQPSLKRKTSKSKPLVTIVSRSDELHKLADLRGDDSYQIRVFRTEGPFDANDYGVRPGDLHAKIYVAEQGNKSWIWLGSANATNHAWKGRNTEAVVKFVYRGLGIIDSFCDDNMTQKAGAESPGKEEDAVQEWCHAVIDALRRCEFRARLDGKELEFRLRGLLCNLRGLARDKGAYRKVANLTMKISVFDRLGKALPGVIPFVGRIKRNMLIVTDQMKKLHGVDSLPSAIIECSVTDGHNPRTKIGSFQTQLVLEGYSFDEASAQCREHLEPDDWAELLWTLLGETVAGSRRRRMRNSGGGHSTDKHRAIRNGMPRLEDWLVALVKDPSLSKIAPTALGIEIGYRKMVEGVINSLTETNDR